MLFNIYWELPLLLILLSEVRKLKIYTQKIDMLLEQLSDLVLYTFPVLHSNRLFLLFGVANVLQVLKSEKWLAYKVLLEQNISLSHILDNEFKNKNIDYTTGMSGLYFLSNLYENLSNDSRFIFSQKTFLERIDTSQYWEFFKQKEFENEDKINSTLNNSLGIGLGLLLFYESS